MDWLDEQRKGFRSPRYRYDADTATVSDAKRAAKRILLPTAQRLDTRTVRQRLIGTFHRAFAVHGLQPDAARRVVTLGAGPVNLDSRTVPLTFSSEARVERSFGSEILSHKKGAADLTRMNSGAPLLFNHNMDDVIGVVEKAAIGDDKRGHATVRFAKTSRGDEVMGMVQDNILRNVSFMYRIDDVDDSTTGYYLVTRWTPMELSIVTVPADASVGVGRSKDT